MGAFKQRRRLLGALLLACCPAAFGAGPMLAEPVDLREEAALVARWGQPLVILFSMPDCAYCPEVRDNYLAPLARAATARPGPIVREIDITSSRRIKDFDGASLTAAEFAKRYKARVTPTVVMLDARGKLLAEPLLGSGMGGFYGAYLEGALDTAQKALRASRKAA
jgi:thioredoxin-related protein